MIRAQQVVTHEINLPIPYQVDVINLDKLIAELNEAVVMLQKLPQAGYKVWIQLANGPSTCGKDHTKIVLHAERDIDPGV